MEKYDNYTPIYLRLRVSEKEKYENDGQWFKDYFKYILPTTVFHLTDYERLKRCYDLANNNLDSFTEEFRKICDPLDEMKSLGVTEEMKPYSMISNEINTLKGEMIKRSNNKFTVGLISQDAIKKKTEQYKEFIRQNRVIPELNLLMQTEYNKLKGMDENKLKQWREEEEAKLLPEDFNIKNFKTDSEILYQKILKYGEIVEDVKTKKVESFEDIIKANRSFVRVYFKHGKPTIEVTNPLYTGFHKSPEVADIHKGDYAYTRKTITSVDLLTVYGDKLTKEQMLELGLYHNYMGAYDKRNDILGGNAKPIVDKLPFDYAQQQFPTHTSQDKVIGTHQANAGTLRDKYSNFVFETHLEFKAFRKIGFLSYNNEYNKLVTEVVSDDFDVPKTATKIKYINKWGDDAIKYEWVDELTMTSFTLEELWIPRRYEVTRLGNTVYINYREVPNQPINIENPYSTFELSYKGIILDNRNTFSISMIERATPYIFQAMMVKHLMNKELAKYTGFVQDINVATIPDELGEDLEGNKVRDKIAVANAYKKLIGVNYYSDTSSSYGMSPSTRSPGSSGYVLGTSNEIMNLQRLWELLNIEIGMVLGISPARKAQSSSSMTASDNERNLNQSYVITEYYFDRHQELWKAVMSEYIKLFRIYLLNNMDDENNHFLSYVSNDGAEEILKITSENLDFDSIGLYLKQSMSDTVYRDMMTNAVFSIAQNAGEGAVMISEIIKQITSGESPDEIHKQLMMYEERINKRNQEIEKMRQEAETKRVQMEIESREDIQKHEIEKITLAGDYDIQKELVRSYINKENQNEDNDGIPDQLEILKQYHQMEVDRNKLQLEKEKLDILKNQKK